MVSTSFQQSRREDETIDFLSLSKKCHPALIALRNKSVLQKQTLFIVFVLFVGGGEKSE
jgi:hypothetical protein